MTETKPAQGHAGGIDHPSGYLALSERNTRFQIPGLAGFIAYREQGKHMVCLGGVHAPEAARAELLDAFLEEAASRKRRIVVVQVSGSQVELFRSRAFTVNSMGATYALSLSGYSLVGTKKMKLRNKIKRAKEQGVRVVEVGADIAGGAAPFEELRRVSGGWLAAKRKKELDFMIGELGTPEDTDRRIFAALDATGKMCAFITYVPAFGRRPGYLHDLTRKMPETPVGVMELINSQAIERFRQEGVPYLHFGFTPFVRCERSEAEDSKAVSWVIQMLERYGESIYPTRTQADYKMKWGPDVIEAEYVAFRPLSPCAVLDLLKLTESI